MITWKPIDCSSLPYSGKTICLSFCLFRLCFNFWNYHSVSSLMNLVELLVILSEILSWISLSYQALLSFFLSSINQIIIFVFIYVYLKLFIEIDIRLHSIFNGDHLIEFSRTYYLLYFSFGSADLIDNAGILRWESDFALS